MKSLRIPLLVVAALATLAAAAQAGRWEAIENLHVRPATLLVNDKARIYYRITRETPLVVPIEGPVQLRIVSRAELAPGSTQVVSYHLRAMEGSVMLDELKTETSGSTQVRASEGNATICKSRRMNVDIPTGRHQLTLAVDGVPSLLVRLQQGASAKGGEPTVSLTPIDAPRSVTVTEGEKAIPYYTTFPGKPVRFRVVGPTRLDLITRLDFDATMRGSQSYTVQISERGKPLRDLTFKTTKATAAIFPDLKDRVPSKFDRARLTIGDGVHEILVTLLKPEGGAAEIHARIPEPTVGSEE